MEKLRPASALMITFAIAGCSAGTSKYLGCWADFYPAVIVGHVVDVATADTIMISRGRDCVLYPSFGSKVIIGEVLKDSAQLNLATGDTATVLFISDVHLDTCGGEVWHLRGHGIGALSPSQVGIFGLELYDGQWVLGGSFRDTSLVSEMRSAMNDPTVR